MSTDLSSKWCIKSNFLKLYVCSTVIVWKFRFSDDVTSNRSKNLTQSSIVHHKRASNEAPRMNYDNLHSENCPSASIMMSEHIEKVPSWMVLPHRCGEADQVVFTKIEWSCLCLGLVGCEMSRWPEIHPGWIEKLLEHCKQDILVVECAQTHFLAHWSSTYQSDQIQYLSILIFMHWHLKQQSAIK
jgi:hypothetical protein